MARLCTEWLDTVYARYVAKRYGRWRNDQSSRTIVSGGLEPISMQSFVEGTSGGYEMAVRGVIGPLHAMHWCRLFVFLWVGWIIFLYGNFVPDNYINYFTWLPVCPSVCPSDIWLFVCRTGDLHTNGSIYRNAFYSTDRVTFLVFWGQISQSGVKSSPRTTELNVEVPVSTAIIWSIHRNNS